MDAIADLRRRFEMAADRLPNTRLASIPVDSMFYWEHPLALGALSLDSTFRLEPLSDSDGWFRVVGFRTGRDAPPDDGETIKSLFEDAAHLLFESPLAGHFCRSAPGLASMAIGWTAWAWLLFKAASCPPIGSVMRINRHRLPGSRDEDRSEYEVLEPNPFTASIVLLDAPFTTPPTGNKKLEAALDSLDQDSKRALAIAQGSGTVDDKMRAICAIDQVKYLAWTSPRWAKLLGVSETAIKKTQFWTVDRKEAIRAYRVIAEENAIDIAD